MDDLEFSNFYNLQSIDSLNKILFNISDFAIIIDKNTKLLYANKSFSETLGYSEKEFSGKDIFTFFMKEDQSDYNENIREKILEDDWEGSVLCKKKNGEEFLGQVNSHNLSSHIKNELILLLVKDLSIQNYQENIKNWIYEISNVITISESLTQLYEYVHLKLKNFVYAENFIVAIYNEFNEKLEIPYCINQLNIDPKTSKQDLAGIKYILKYGSSIIASKDMWNDDIKTEIVFEKVEPLIDWMGIPILVNSKIIGALVIQSYDPSITFNDRDKRVLTFLANHLAPVVDRKIQEEKLRSSEEKFRTLTELLSAGILIIQNKNIKYVNSTIERISGYKQKELLKDDSLMNAIHPSYRELVKTELYTLREGIKSKSKFDIEFITKGNGIKWLSITAKKITYLSKPAVIATVYDITERKEFEEESERHIEELQIDRELIENNAIELTKLNYQLIKSEKELKKLNSNKDKLFSIISHDLRSPFNVIIGYSDLLVKEIETYRREEIVAFAKSIYDSSYTFMDLLDSLLEWSMFQTGRIPNYPVQLQLKEFVIKTISILEKTAAKKGISIIYNDLKDSNVFVDEKILRSVLLNLISNAIKFSYQDGVINVFSLPTDEKTYLAVQDNGIGIEKKNIEKLFKLDQHFTNNGTANEIGTGLGLILCRELIDKIGGEIKVQSEIGNGSTFYFSIPHTAINLNNKDNNGIIN